MIDTTFREPTTLEECQDRRQSLVTELTSLQAMMSSRKNNPKFARWAEVNGHRLRAIAAELGYLKGWLQTFRRNFQRSILAGEDAGAVAANAKGAVAKMIELLNAQAAEIAELNAENARLRDRLREAMPESPNDGIDEWREP